MRVVKKSNHAFKWLIYNKQMKNNLPMWDLSDFYSSINDPQIEKDYQLAKRKAEQFEKKYREKINDRLEGTELQKAFKEYEAILSLMGRLYVYARLTYSIASNDPAKGALYQKIYARYIQITNLLLFFDLSLTKLSEKKLRQFLKDPALKNYSHYLKKLLVWKPHRLSEREEKILNDKYLTSSAAFSRLFETRHSNKKFEYKGKQTTESEVLEKLYSGDREVRKTAAKALTKGLGEDEDLMGFIYNTIIQDKAITTRYHRFSKPESSRHLENEIEQEVVDTLVSVVKKSYPLVADYYALKKRLLGYKNLYDYDRYAAVFPSKTKISFEKAKGIVLGAYKDFSQTFYEKAKEFYDKGWIDAKPRIGKENGAYCMSVTPDEHPMILVNYNGNMRDVLTVAHELGHGIHASISRQQTLLNYDTPLTTAETASIFGEMLVFHRLKSTLKSKKEILSLYLAIIEEIIASVHRQIAMFLFERDMHETSDKKGELTTKEIGERWSFRQQEIFGKSVSITPDHDVWWSYIPHIIRTPFYVYAYAFGNLLTLALYARYQQEGEVFVKKYVEFLSSGGAKSPNELLTPMGVDLTQPVFWQGGIDIIAELIEEAKGLAKEI